MRNNKGDFQKGNIPWNKGIKCPKTSKEKNPNWKGGKVKTKCLQCSKEFETNPCWIKRGRGKYCSLKCFCKSKKGKPSWNTGLKGVMPIPWNKKHSGIHLNPAYEFKKGHIPAHKGKKLLCITGNRHWNWKGGQMISRGYIWIYSPKHPFRSKAGYILEHHLEIEKQIGRYLKPKEVGHHLGEKTDNRPHKLMAFINQSAHKRFENGGIVKPEEIIFDGRKLH